MKIFKAIALIFILGFISCDPVEEFIDNVTQGLQFLADITQPIKEDGLITLKDCSSNPIFKITGMKSKPNHIEKGGTMSLLVIGKMLEAQHVKKLDIYTTCNGEKMLGEDTPKEAVVEENKV
jgi:hypothetical protein